MDIGYMFKRSAAFYPRKIALIDGDRRLTYQQANRTINSLASALRCLGGKKGDRVVIILPNSIEFVLADFATIKAGMVSVPLNRRLTPREISYITNDSEAVTFIYHESYLSKIEEIRPELETVKNFICAGKACGDLSLSDLIATYPDTDPGVEIDEKEDLARMSYTAGTTGKPKGAMITHSNLRTAASNLLIDRFHPGEGDTFLVTAPLNHGTGTMILSYYFKGASIAIIDQFDVQNVFEIIRREKVTAMGNLVPTMIKMLIDYPEINNYDFSSLKQINYGAAPINDVLLREALKYFGQIFVQGYGLSEAPLSNTILHKKDHVADGPPGAVRRLRSVGREITNVRLKIVDEKGREAGPEEPGEIIVRGDHVMKGYWKNPQATAEKIRDGWFHTQDIGKKDAEGYVYLLDRKGDLIISGGFNVYPKEVEEVLNQHPGVEECAVIGVPHEKWGEAVKALVVAKPGAGVSEKELIDFCSDKVAGYKKPKSVDFVGELPRTAFGKVSKKDLREKYWAGRERSI